MDLSSTALTQGSDMPQQYICEGDDVAPPLCWSDVPDRTRSLALIVDDPDAPDPAAPTMTWVHWVLVDIPPTVAAIPEGGQPLPDGSRDGLNDWHRTVVARFHARNSVACSAASLTRAVCSGAR